MKDTKGLDKVSVHQENYRKRDRRAINGTSINEAIFKILRGGD